MSHVDLVVIVKELHLEGEGVVEASALFLQRILEVTNISSVTVPSDALAVLLVRRFLGVKQGLHALVVRALRLNQIDKVEFVSDTSSCISNSEVVPLGVSFCVEICF